MKKIEVGQYKKLPNHVLLSNGEIFEYANPVDVPKKMHDLVALINDPGDMHPVELSAKAHYWFVRIHPFDDGNGRTARLIMNYILMKNLLPPITIQLEHKNEYLSALALADAGDMDSFIDFIAAIVMRRMRQMISQTRL